MARKFQCFAFFLIFLSFSWLCIQQGMPRPLDTFVLHKDANEKPKSTFLKASHVDAVVVKGSIVEGYAKKNINSSGPSPCGPGHCPKLNN
ncbi:hypothetical protein GLYMA_20G128200v4 [Glycine max]|nr:hypothetical protein GLYMA_20G128200v4 [Glycine max]